MIRSAVTPRRPLLLVLALALLLPAAACLFYFYSPVPSAGQATPPSQSYTPDRQRAESARTTAPTEAKTWPNWGGAITSAEFDGAGFFDRQIARTFSASVHPDVKKYVVQLMARDLLPLGGEDKIEDVLPGAAGNPEQPRIAYLQFYDHPSPVERETLKAQGIELLSFFNGYTWSARGTRDAFKTLLKRPTVRALARIDPRDKLSPAVFSGAIPPHARAGADDVRMRFVSQPGLGGEPFAALLNEKNTLNFQMAAASVLGARADVTGNLRLLSSYTRLDAVAFVDFAAPSAASRDATTDLESNIDDVRDQPVAPLTVGLSGAGVSVAIRELGRIDSHVDFTGRFQRVDDVATSSGDGPHATGVTGQVGAAGIKIPEAKGVAPAVALLGYTAGINSAGPDLFSTADITDAETKGARISNHSYGPITSGGSTSTASDNFGTYDIISADWDAASRSKNLLTLFSGNEEKGGLSGHIDFFVGNKNGLCVGATNSLARAGDDNPATSPVSAIASYSEFGPMDDGRIKPDLVAFGGDVREPGVDSPRDVILVAGTDSVQNSRGTSFAAPAVAGMAALVFQQYKTKVGSNPSAALTKALLCNSATDLGLAGPDAAFGFGIANVEAAVATINQRESETLTPFVEDEVGNGLEKNYSVKVAGSVQLKLTLCWMDAPGVPASRSALVNDLDVDITDPSGTIHFPYSLAPVPTSDTPLQAATRTARNTVDPIEQIVVNNPANGTWNVRVRGASVPLGPQSFAVVFNQQTAPPPLTVSIFASPTSGSAPLPVTFAASGTGSKVKYSWFFPDDNSVQNDRAVAEHTFKTSGVHLVKLTAVDSFGETIQVTKAITVSKREVHSFGASASVKVDLTTGTRSDDIQLSMIANDPIKTIGDLVAAKGYIWPRTRQQSREAIRDGEFEGKRYRLSLIRTVGQGETLQTFTYDIENILLDRRASYKKPETQLSLNLLTGEVKVRLKGTDLDNKLGMDFVTTGPLRLTLKLEGDLAVYSADYEVPFTSNGFKGTGKNP